MNRVRVSQKLPWGGDLDNKPLEYKSNIKNVCCRNLVLSCFLCGNNFFAYCFLCENRIIKRIENYKNIWYTNNVQMIDRSVRI